jgi:hypothetical protein
VKLYITSISEKYNIDKKELEQMWSEGNISKKSSKPIVDIDMEDLSIERLMKCTKQELIALCKSHRKKCTGKKEELIARLQEKEEIQAEKKAIKTGKSVRSTTQSVDVINKLTSNITAIAVRKNAYENLEHPETRLVFDKNTKKVYGRQEDDGSVSELVDEDIENCKKFKFPYDVPSNLDKKSRMEQVKVDELDDEEDEVEVVNDEDEEVEVVDDEGSEDNEEEEEEEILDE